MKRVLLVDDDRDVLEALGDWLRLEHDVQLAGGFPEAMAALLEGPLPDVVITDYDMPPYRGTDLLAIVAGRFPGIGRVLHTASDFDRREARVAHYILRKGCELRDFIDVIARCG
jgi:two-component system C4-dicarboxylate transport response regulator DctD